jgi:excinuclease UvrABC nuclease subunit
MRAAAEKLEFEKAIQLRDQIEEIQKSFVQNRVHEKLKQDKSYRRKIEVRND